MNKSNLNSTFISIVIILLIILPITNLSVNGQFTELPNYFTWINKTPMPTSRYAFGLTVVDDKIFAIGGTASDGKTRLATNEMYNPTKDVWETRTPIPSPRRAHATTTYQNKIYIIGGSDSKANEVYDPTTDTWENKTALPSQYNRNFFNAHTVNEKIYVISGMTDKLSMWSPNSPEVNIYNPTTDTWTNGKQIPYPVSKYASAVIDDKIYVFGGIDYSAGPIEVYDLTQIYDTTTDTWSLGTPLPENMHSCVATVSSGPWGIYVLGGVVNDIPSYVTQIYDPIKNSWSYGTSLPKVYSGSSSSGLNVALSYPSGVITVDDHMYAVSGTHTLKHIISGTETPSPTSTPISGPDPTPIPSIEPTSTPPNDGPTSPPTSPTPLELEAIVGITILIAVLGVGIGFLVYLIKKK